MSGRVRGCSTHDRRPLGEGWMLCESAAGALADPSALAEAAREGRLIWTAAQVPGTVASSLGAAGLWDADRPRALDASDWWYRLEFDAGQAERAERNPRERQVLRLEGLATLAEAWLNGERLLESDNMFVAHEVDVGARLRAHNELLLCFRALEPHLHSRRGRPRWRTPMVERQSLRWVRTTLLGRTPGWSPPAPPVGPWRGIYLESRRELELRNLRLDAQLSDGCGVVSVDGLAVPIGALMPRAAALCASDGEAEYRSRLHLHSDHAGDTSERVVRLEGALRIDRPRRWWPHTHGHPALYRVWLELELELEPEPDPDPVSMPGAGAAQPVIADLGPVGFRTVRLDRGDGDFRLSVNGVDVFCRGACWTPLDPIGLQADRERHAEAVAQVREAGMNMLRICGPMVYEQDALLDLCDEQGVLLWQDFMFANMDYPSDATFLDGVRREAEQQLSRLQAHAALAVLCGNSEVAQQAAMAGAGPDEWAPALFQQHLAALAREWCPQVPYTPSSTHGGDFPHQASAGVCSYYGVGAYLRALSDAGASQLRFASEALAFANVPERALLERLAGGTALRVHHPRWKARVPRDLGAGWDFDDVRDHYLARLFGVDPLQLRYADHERYLQLSRVVGAEVMAAAFAQWRRAGSRCRGALVWFLRDLWAGAGWGIIDAEGAPKAAYHALRRVLQPISLLIADEGLNGLVLHVCNETPETLNAQLELALFRWDAPVGIPYRSAVQVPPRTTLAVPATDLTGSFLDLSYAYRFGPASYDLLWARLLPADAPEANSTATPTIGNPTPSPEAFHFPLGLPNRVDGDAGLAVEAAALPGGHWAVTLSAHRFAQSVHLEAPGFAAQDQYFHLAPGARRIVRLIPVGAAPARTVLTVQPLNARTPCRVSLAG